MIIKHNDFLCAIFRHTSDGFCQLDEVPALSSVGISNREVLRVFNACNPKGSMCFNPLQFSCLPTLRDVRIYADRIVRCFGDAGDNSLKTAVQVASDLLTATIWFFMSYDVRPFDEDGHALYFRSTEIAPGAFMPKGHVYNIKGNPVMPAFWRGRFSDMPHVFAYISRLIDNPNSVNLLFSNPASENALTFFRMTKDYGEYFGHDDAFSILRSMLSTFSKSTICQMLSVEGEDFRDTPMLNSDYVLLVPADRYDQLDALSRVLCHSVLKKDGVELSYSSLSESAARTLSLCSSLSFHGYDRENLLILADQVYSEVEEVCFRAAYPDIESADHDFEDLFGMEAYVWL